MKVLTLHQPWASLVALGVKTIETRSWSTNYRGPLAIHAGAQKPAWAEIGDYYAEPWFGEVRHVEDCCCEEGGIMPECARRSKGRPVLTRYSVMAAELPLGAIVATTTLVDVARIGHSFDFRSGIFDGDEGDEAGRPVVFHHPSVADLLPESLILDPPSGATVDITDQIPYGDFTPGRFAWLLADIEPVEPPVPFSGGQGLTKTWIPEW